VTEQTDGRMSQTESLDVPTGTGLDEGAAEDKATKAFSTSILISAVRCTLTYVLFPWVLPLVHLGSGVGPGVGVAVGLIAIASNLASIRRFWVSGHRYRNYVIPLNVGVIILLSVLLVADVGDLLS
jgi:hypothetical protein